MSDQISGYQTVTENWIISIRADASGNNYTVYFNCFPDSITEIKQANYSHVDILGRSEPYRGFVNNPPRIFQWEFAIWHPGPPTPEGITSSQGGLSGGQYVQKQVAILRSFLYPEYTRGVTLPPTPCYLHLGKWTLVRGILTQLVVNWQGPWDLTSPPISGANGFNPTGASSISPGDRVPPPSRPWYPHVALCSATFVEVAARPYDRMDVVNLTDRVALNLAITPF